MTKKVDWNVVELDNVLEGWFNFMCVPLLIKNK